MRAASASRKVAIRGWVKTLLKAMADAGLRPYLVGASARWALSGQPNAPTRLALVTAGDPEVIRDVSAGKGWRVEGPTAEGSLILSDAEGVVNIRTLGTRTDEEVPQPSDSTGVTAHLFARLFRVDAVAVDGYGRVLDPFGGQADLDREVIATIEPADALFEKDPRAIMQAAALTGETGYRPDPSMVRAAEARSHLVAALPPSVIREELERVLMTAHPAEGLEFLMRTRVLDAILPEVTSLVGFEQTAEYRHKDLWGHTKLAVSQARPVPAMRWALLLHDLGKVYTRTVEKGEVRFYKHEQVSRAIAAKITRRLRFEPELRRQILFLVSNHMKPGQYDDSWTDSAVRRFARKAGPMVEALIDLSRADMSSKNPRKVYRNLRVLDRLLVRLRLLEEADQKKIRLPTGLGNLIMERFGLPRGPHIGELMAELKEDIEAGRVARGLASEAYVEHIAGKHPELGQEHGHA